MKIKLFNKYRTAHTQLEPQELYRVLKSQVYGIKSHCREKGTGRGWKGNMHNGKQTMYASGPRQKRIAEVYLTEQIIFGSPKLFVAQGKHAELLHSYMWQVALYENTLTLKTADTYTITFTEFPEALKKQYSMPLPEVYVVDDILEEIPNHKGISWKRARKLAQQVLEQRLK